MGILRNLNKKGISFMLKNIFVNSVIVLIGIFITNCSTGTTSTTPIPISTDIYSTSTIPVKLGTITAQPNPDGSGIVLTPNIGPNSVLTEGTHGFHIHNNPSCGNQGNDAGTHWDPANTMSHQGAYGNGHLGDLPVLHAASDGSVTQRVIAPRIKLNEIINHSYIIHENSDSYNPSTPVFGTGGAGSRKACGIIQ